MFHFTVLQYSRMTSKNLHLGISYVPHTLSTGVDFMAENSDIGTSSAQGMYGRVIIIMVTIDMELEGGLPLDDSG